MASGLVRSVQEVRGHIDDWAVGDKHALRAAAACRIGTGLAVLGLLLSNFSTRDLWVGQGSVWAEPARAISRFPELALLDGVSPDILTLVYVVTMLAALAFALGWHAKAANVVTFVGFIAIVGQNPVVGAPGDHLIRLTLLWMLLMRSADHWSLDALRQTSRLAAGKRAAREEDALPVWLSTGLHNVGLLALGAQMVLSSMAAGLDKVAERPWQQGTALYSTMQLPEFRPFPALSDLLSHSTVLLALLTYGVLLSQLFFGPLLFNPWTRRVLIVVVGGVNLVLALVFAQPWSALSTIAVALLFVSDETWERVEHWSIERGYDVLDLSDAVRYNVVLPAVDWVRFTLVRR
ncbi:HTTM domain-containing protein [Aeromicrobium wangtongii]|uniref:HTTM domain-containing protein n=1 Tax=Aeromicrobium wangtongii TaxID=2969247 RepID=A0ABY5MDM8_9ACTN|nr:HTTM domain-containing protein [Aeromicrobium wangtongii]MCD9197293.1 HTTM domain-containing protein [Aeromicrobium wangtongii]UUP14788.1 HTTM domain-containing protein [Aeromicrobium wangtongii]